jgi:hypothetical protein
MNWECHAIGYYTLADKNLRLVGIVIEPTEDLRRLQQRIIDAVAPFAVEQGTGEAFPVRAVSVSLYQMGDYGVAQRKLHELHRC